MLILSSKLRNRSCRCIYHKRQSQKSSEPDKYSFGIGSVLNWFIKVAWPTEPVDTNQQTPVYRFFPLKHSLHSTCSFARHIKHSPWSTSGLPEITIINEFYGVNYLVYLSFLFCKMKTVLSLNSVNNGTVPLARISQSCVIYFLPPVYLCHDSWNIHSGLNFCMCHRHCHEWRLYNNCMSKLDIYINMT